MFILAQGIIVDQKIVRAIQRSYDIDPPKTGGITIKSRDTKYII